MFAHTSAADRRCDQDCRAAALGAQETAQRLLKRRARVVVPDDSPRGWS